MLTYAEDDLLPISALQHLLFCERQVALIHLERLWADNRFTAEGNVLHRKAHDGKPETRDGERIARGLPLRSLELGLSGVADIVLYRPPDDFQIGRRSLATALRQGSTDELARWTVAPVEYKRGRPKKNDADRVQLCAQAMCLEEMHAIRIPAAALFYGQTRRRTEVALDHRLRRVTRDATVRLRAILASDKTPRAKREKKCETCSLLPLCLPTAVERRSARQFLNRQLTGMESDESDA